MWRKMIAMIAVLALVGTAAAVVPNADVVRPDRSVQVKPIKTTKVEVKQLEVRPVFSTARSSGKLIPRSRVPKIMSKNPGDSLYFYNSVNNDAIGLSDGGTYQAAIRLTPDELSPYGGWQLTEVLFYHHENVPHSGAIIIYGPNQPNRPGDTLAFEPYTAPAEGWISVPLSTPVMIDPSSELWISVEITHAAGEYPIAVDDGPAVPGKGDWVAAPDAGLDWGELRDYGLDYNWNIVGIVELAGDSLDPLPPSDLTAYSDYTTPTSIHLEWVDPTHYVGGDTLTDFNIEIWMADLSAKDSTPIATVPAGTQSYDATGLTDGHLYAFYLRTVDYNDSTSNFVSTSWYAGGSPYPAPPHDLTATVLDDSTVELTWINPATQSDGTPLDDLAGINIYVDGILAETYATTDTGALVVYDVIVTPGRHTFYVTAIDNEDPVHESDPSNVVEVVTNVHSGGPDGYGYTFIDSDHPNGPAFEWIDITTTGTPLNLDDDAYTTVQLSFPFPFYDTTYTSIDIQSNGTITFHNDYFGLSNGALPTNAYDGPWDLIAFYWSDQNPSDHGQVYFQDFGTYAVIEFFEIPEYGGTAYNTYEVILYMNGDIVMNYETVADYSDETIGIQDASAYPDGDWYLQYTYDGDPLVPHDSLAIYWTYPSYTHDVGVASITEPVPGGNYDLGATITPVVSVVNNGEQTETFDVTAEIFNGDSLLYTSTATATANPDEVVDVTFSDFTVPDYGTYHFVVYTTLAGDENPNNDTLDCYFFVVGYSEDFEATDGGFVPDPQTGAWEWGAPTVGPAGAHSGVNLWGTVLNGEYENNADWSLYTLDYIATLDNPVLTFWHWYDIETGYDGGNVAISTDGGATWTVIEPEGGYPDDDITGLNGEPGYTGHDATWMQATFVLNGITSGTIFKIRFRFGSDGSVTYPGWYIDDVAGVGFVPYLLDHDVGAVSIEAPFGPVLPGSEIVPMGTVRNYGANTETFDVVLMIDSLGKTIVYADTQTVTLDPLTQTMVFFEPWIAQGNPGDMFNVSLRTLLASDENPDNDEYTTTVWIPEIVEIPATATAPVLDGVIDPAEWGDALVIDVGDTLGMSPPAQPAGANMMYIKNDGSYLYMAFDITTDASLTDYDQIGLYIDDNGDGEWASDGSEGNNNILPASDIGWASRVITPGPTFGDWVYPRNDRADCFAISVASGHVVYEIKLPYGNETTPDPAFLGTMPGQVFGMWIMYAEETSNEHHIWWPQEVDTADWANPLVYAKLTLGTPTVEENPVKPALEFRLIGGVNPVKGNSPIMFSIPRRAKVKLTLFDAAGRLVSTLADGEFDAGVHSVRLDASRLTNGVYFVRMEAGDYSAVKKITVLK